ncbi:MAG TPA: hypothetical protein ENJ82_08770 [Bacteroidetes bacterium]|nr:hypothetical protein [Bacteroidota bacterium]
MAIMITDVRALYNQELCDLWENNRSKDLGFPLEKGPKTLIDRNFCGPASVTKGGLLFLGLNPSYSKKRKKAGLTRWEISENSPLPYFKAFYEVWKESTYEKENIPVSALDMFFVRETISKKVLEMIRKLDGRAFLTAQLEIFQKILEECQPSVIVAANTTVRELLSDQIVLSKENGSILPGCGYDVSFDENIGTHKIQIKNRTVPIFLTSMLSGQRALDIGSRRRLIWHLNLLLKKAR